MTGEIYDYPTRVLVHSESEGEDSYLCELTDFNFNGSCTCPHFTFRLAPLLKDPANRNNRYRCKHIKFARDLSFEFLLPKIAAADPNLINERIP